MYEGVSIIHAKSSWQLLGPEQLGMILGPLYILAPPHHFHGAAPKIFAAGNWGACGVRFLHLVSCGMLYGGWRNRSRLIYIHSAVFLRLLSLNHEGFRCGFPLTFHSCRL